ncbi:hypothetical protein ABPG72_018617 [Tetrahymena utriculariae]
MKSNQSENLQSFNNQTEFTEERTNYIKKQFSQIKSDLLEQYKPEINSLFKQILLKMQDQQSHKCYEPSLMKNQNILLIDKVNYCSKKMTDILNLQQEALKLKNESNSEIVLQERLQKLQNKFKRAQKQQMTQISTLKKQKQRVEQVCNQYKCNQEYLKKQMHISQLEKEVKQTISTLNDITFKIEEINKNLNLIKAQKEETKIQIDSQQQNISETDNKLKEYIQLKNNSQKDYLNQRSYLNHFGIELKIHIFDKQCGEDLCFYEMYKQLDNKALPVIYQNLSINTFSEEFSNSDKEYDIQKNKSIEILKLQWNLEQLFNSNQTLQHDIDKHINSIRAQLQENEIQQNEFYQEFKIHTENINKLEQQKISFSLQMNDINISLASKQDELKMSLQNISIFENQLKKLEQEKYLSTFQTELNQANRECDSIQIQIVRLKSTLQSSQAQSNSLQDLISLIETFYEGIKQEIYVLFSYIYLFSGQDNFLLLILAQNFDSQNLIIEDSLEKNLQKVFNLDQRVSGIVLKYIYVHIKQNSSNSLDILFEPNPQDEIEVQKLNKIINQLNSQIAEKTKHNIQKVQNLSTQQLLFQSLKDNIERTK